MSLRKSVLACRFFRSGRLGRCAASLCLFVIFFNLLGPAFWVAAHERTNGGAPLCLSSEAHGNTNGSAPQDGGAIIHCPLCALLVGSMVAPPHQLPGIFAFGSAPPDEFRICQQLPFAQLPPDHHPTPRGPPVLL